MDDPWKPIDDLLELDKSFAGRRTILERYLHMLQSGWTPNAEEVIPLVEIILHECLGGQMQKLAIPDVSDCETCTSRVQSQMITLSEVKCKSISGLRCDECGREYALFVAE